MGVVTGKNKTPVKTGVLAVKVGMARFELAAPRPPDEYSNRAELHPEVFCAVIATDPFIRTQIYKKNRSTNYNLQDEFFTC